MLSHKGMKVKKKAPEIAVGRTAYKPDEERKAKGEERKT
jgi:hypothetical protein